MLLVRSVLSVLAVLAVAAIAQAQTSTTGRITGRVLDTLQGLAMPGVTVEVPVLKLTVVTDVDGRYRLELPAGRHQIKVTMQGFAARLLDVDVAAGITKDVDVALALATITEEITVQGDMSGGDASSLAAQLVERRRASAILDNLGGTEMKANADSTAAAALQRVTGLSLVDNQFVFVRGLGERYSNTTLNGALLPSMEPERKVVSLDMFPAGLLESVSIVKSYTADRPAEFAGGLVEIVPSRLPNRRMTSFSYSFGGNGQAMGKDVLDHGAGSHDWLGFSNDARRLSAAFPDRRVVRGGIFTPEVGVVGSELEALGESLVNEWSPAVRSGKPNQGFSASFGDRWGRFGLSASASHSYRNDYQDEAQVYYSIGENDALVPFSTYRYKVGENRALFSTLVNAGYALSPSHRFSFQAFTTDKGTRETRTFEGYNDDIARNLRNSRLLWQEENLRSFQFSGDHVLGGLSNSRIDWRASFSRSNHDEPDIRETLYQELPNVGYVLADESQSGLRMFNDLDEDTWDVSLSWTRHFGGVNGLPASIKVGPSYSQRQRDFASRRFRFVPINVVRFDLRGTPEQLFTPANIGPVFELREETRTTDAYAAEQTIGAGFGQLDLALSTRARLIAGARVENYRQQVDTFDLFGLDLALEGEDNSSEIIRGEIKQTDIFPAVNLVYDLGGGRNIRIGFSQTVNRPDFRELAPFEFTDIVGGRAVVGNPDLERSLIRNVDVRWEWFPGATEIVAASVFFKSFDQPIERFIEPTSQLRTSFTNAKSARNFGIELEGRRDLGRGVIIGGNYTFVDSTIALESFQTNVLTSLDRPLSGTSRHLVNAMVEANVRPVTARVLVNYFSDRIVDVGALGLPDIVEEGRPSLDLVVSARLGSRLSVRFAGENLGNRAVRFLQGGQVHRRFEYGRTFGVQFSVTGR
jgi:hypothetical protein